MVQNRLSPYIEDNGHFPTTMYGFRPHLSTQDVLLQLKEEIIDRLTSTHKRCILALDIKGAFDNISHQAILQGLTSIDCGQRTYDYITAFLTGRTATIGIGHLRSNTFKTISKGTPQGSVISPLLFNIAMKDLPPLLQNIPHLRHAIYADDLTLWTPTGSMETLKDLLEEMKRKHIPVPLILNGNFETHLGHGVMVATSKLKYILGARGDSVFCKESTKVVFGTANLQRRSVTGQACRRLKGSAAKRALTQNKLAAVGSQPVSTVRSTRVYGRVNPCLRSGRPVSTVGSTCVVPVSTVELTCVYGRVDPTTDNMVQSGRPDPTEHGTCMSITPHDPNG
ncbi:hypothetical protein ISCGN_026957 [Ixodes scapularis]